MKRFFVRPAAPITVMHGLKWDVIDRTTGKAIDQATTRYEARMAASGWNDGVYGEPVAAWKALREAQE